jgi:Tol biopolymer transport system component
MIDGSAPSARIRSASRPIALTVGLWLIGLLSACGPAGPATSGAASPSPSALIEPTTSLPPVASLVPSPEASSLGSSEGRIVFVRLEPAAHHYSLFTMNPDGSHLRELLPGYPNGFGLPRWSWAGTLIAANSGGGHDGYETILPNDAPNHVHFQPPSSTINLVCAGWSADDTRLVCDGSSATKPSDNGLYTVSATNGGDLRLLTFAGGLHDVPGDYSADGSQIAFVRTSYAVLGLGQIWICDADGGNAHKISDTLTTYRISWSVDGRWIVGVRNGGLEVLDLQNLTVDPRLVTFKGAQASEPRWSPDGTRILFVYTKTGSGKTSIATVNTDGSGLKLLTTGNADLSPDWGVPGF